LKIIDFKLALSKIKMVISYKKKRKKEKQKKKNTRRELFKAIGDGLDMR